MVYGLFFIKDSENERYEVMIGHKEGSGEINDKSEKLYNFASAIAELKILDIPNDIWKERRIYFTLGFNESEIEAISFIRDIFLKNIDLESKLSELRGFINKRRVEGKLSEDDIPF